MSRGRLEMPRRCRQTKERRRRLFLECLEPRFLLTAGANDPSFGTSGLVIGDLGLADNFGEAAAVQADGSIVVAGTTKTTSDNDDFLLARFSSTGELDSSFGTNGFVTTPIGGGTDLASDVALLPDGRILVAGSSVILGDYDFAIARYHPDGSLDSSFGGDGIVTTHFGFGDDEATSLAITDDGGVVVAGRAWNGNNYDVAVARYFSDGRLDASFDGDGRVRRDIVGGDDAANDLAVASDGKLVLAGSAWVLSDDDFLVMRLHSGGQMDWLDTVDFALANDGAHSVALSPGGAIVAAGYATVGGDTDFAVVRYLSNGTLDGGFGTGGRATIDLAGGDDLAAGVAVAADGKIVVGGIASAASNDFGVARLTTAGALDSTFGSGGKATVDFGSIDFAGDLLLPSASKILVVGAARVGSDFDLGLARLLNDALAPDELELNPQHAPTDLGRVTGTLVHSQLSLHDTDDEDWFRFELAATGTSSDFLRIDLQHVLGDVDVSLHDSQGSLLDLSLSVADREEISLAGRLAGIYLVKVFGGLSTSVSPEYALTIHGPLAGDAHEPNETLAAAADLGTMTGQVLFSGLSIDRAGDVDWYRFSTTGDAASGHAVRIDFSHASGDLDMRLFDSAGNSLGSSLGVTDSEQISLAGLPAGTYHVQVVGFLNAVNPQYALTLSTPGAGGLTADRLEPNDVPGEATDLGVVLGQRLLENLSLHHGADFDRFALQISATGDAGHFVRVDFSHALGDVDLRLYDSTAQEIGRSLGVSNREEISLAGLPAGTYYVGVETFLDGSNPSYSLTINAPGGGSGDALESNNSLAAATVLRDVAEEGRAVHDHLSIHQAGDQDFFQFALEGAATASHFARIDFSHTLGDVDLRLLDEQGNVVGGSFSVGDTEEISLAGRPAGIYILQVYGFSGSVNPYYRLWIEAPGSGGPAADAFEPNNAAGGATDLGVVAGQRTWNDLSIHPAGDEDWYRFTISSGGTAGHEVSVDFRHEQGDIDLALFRADGMELLDFSVTTTDREAVSLSGLSDGAYLVRVYGFQSAPNPDYSLTIRAPGVAAGEDRFEPNDGITAADEATDLGLLAGEALLQDLSIDELQDEDWFRLEIGEGATEGHAAAIVFNHAAADLTLELFNSAGVGLAQSQTSSDFEILSLAGRPAGVYYLRVASVRGIGDYAVVLNTPGVLGGDSYEPNQVLAEAAFLGPVEGQKELAGLSIHASGDEDWFTFETVSTGGASDAVAIAFQHLEGDLDLELFDQAGTRIALSNGTSDLERVSLAGLPAGTYSLRVYGFQGAHDLTYGLTVTAPVSGGLLADSLEGAAGNNRRENAADLGRIDTSYARQGLSIHAADDKDWFRIELLSPAMAGHRVELSFAHQLGDIDLELYDAAGTLLESSRGVTDSEIVSLEGRAAGQYFLRVVGYQNAVQPSYALRITAPGSSSSAEAVDALESSGGNNDRQTATTLSLLQGQWTRTDLSLHSAGDEDWYQFDTSQTSHNRHGAGILFNPEEGQLRLELFADDGTLLAASSGLAGLEAISLADRPAGSYLLHVQRVAGSAGQNYALAISAPAPIITVDWSEGASGNDAPAAASALGEVAAFWGQSSLSLHDASDEDWFRFSTPADPHLAPTHVIAAFDHDEGNANLQLYSADGTTLLAESAGTGPVESVGLPPAACIAAGDCRQTFLVRVFGEFNPHYTLAVLAPETTADSELPASSGQDRSTQQLLADRLEAAGNGGAANAYDLGDIRSLYQDRNLSLHASTDEDWFRFSLTAEGGLDDQIGVSFAHDQVDVDIVLLAADGTTELASSRGVDDSESISLAHWPSGVYFLRVLSYRGAGPYALAIDGPAAAARLPVDWAEPNDAAGQARSLGAVSGPFRREQLSLQAGNDDWFEIQTLATGGENDAVSISFTHAAGDLDLYLYNASQELLDFSTGIDDEEVITLAGRPAGAYFLQVVGYQAVANPSYQLRILAPSAAAQVQVPLDALETNDTALQAHDFGMLRSPLVRRQLSVHAADEDWFEFEIAGTGATTHFVALQFDRAEGDVDLELYDASGQTLLASSTGADHLEFISLRGRPAGAYLVRAIGVAKGTSPEYTLIISPPDEEAASIPPDRLEPNDERTSAFDLRQTDAGDGSRGRPIALPVATQSQLSFLFNNNVLGYADFPASLYSPNATPFEFAQLGPYSVGNMFNVGVGSSAQWQSGAPPISILHNQLAPHLGGFNVNQLIGSSPALSSAFAGLSSMVGTGGTLSSIFQSASNGFGGSNFGGPLSGGGIASQLGLGSSGASPFGFASLPPGQPVVPPALIIPPWEAAPQMLGNYLPSNQPALGAGPAFPLPAPPAANSSSGGQTLSPIATVNVPSEAAQEIVNLPLNLTLNDLTVHNSADHDWFRFELTQSGQVGDHARILFTDQQGNLDFRLYDASGSLQPLRHSTGRSDGEEISLAGLGQGVYYLEVSGADGATSPSYRLQVSAAANSIPGSAPAATSGDPFEPNDVQAVPYDLRNVEGQRLLQGAAIAEEDADWYRFELAATGGSGHFVRIDFAHARGDLDLLLFRTGETTPIDASLGTDDREEISLTGLEPGTYEIQVFGYGGDVSPGYVLTFSAPQASNLPADRFERPLANNALAEATDFRTLGGAAVHSNLTLHASDEDWYRFQTVAPSSAGHDVRIQRDLTGGPVRAELYSAAGDLLRSFQSATGYEVISLAGLPEAAYYVRVFSTDGGQGRYQLLINPPSRAETPDDWTVMVYMTASSLEIGAFEDINEMEAMAARLGGSVNIAVLWDQNSAPVENRLPLAFSTPVEGELQPQVWGDAGRAIIRPDQEPLRDREDIFEHRIVTPFERIGERNTGDPDALVEFVEWAMEQAPAERYALILWDHGSGLWGTNQDFDVATIGLSEDTLTSSELIDALDALEAQQRPRLDLIGFDACLQAMTEVAFSLQDYADVIVASQEPEANDGWEYHTALEVLRTNPSAGAEALASSFVRSYGERYGTETRENTLSAILTAPLEELTDALADFAEYARESASGSDWGAILRAAAAASAMSGKPEYRDLAGMMERIASHPAASSALVQFAEAVDDALEDAILTRTTHRSDVGGLSIYLPAFRTAPNYALEYGEFVLLTDWQQFLPAVQQRIALLSTVLNFAVAASAGFGGRSALSSADWAEPNDTLGDAFPLRDTAGRGFAFGGLTLAGSADVDWYRFSISATGGVDDAIELTFDDEAGLLQLQLLDPLGQPLAGHAAVAGAGRQTISLEALPAGEYLIRVFGNGDLVPYGLAIDAPAAVNAADWAAGNDTADKAYDLGVINRELVAPGLRVQSAAADWFAFSTPRNEAVAPGFVRVHVPEGMVTLTLMNTDRQPLDQIAGTGVLDVPFDSGGGNSYLLEIRSTASNPVAYTLNLADPQNSPPLIEAASEHAGEDGTPLVIPVVASDADGDDLSWSLVGDAPDGIALDEEQGELRWTPSEAQSPGEYELRLRVEDDGLPPLATEFALLVTVAEHNDPPASIALTGTAIAERLQGASVGDVSFSDPENDSIALTVDDSRFEIVGGTLRLRSDQFMRKADGEFLPVIVTATDAGSPAQALHSLFVLQVTDNPAPWTNVADPLDIDGSGRVSPIDVAIVIGELNNRRFSDPLTRQLPEARPAALLNRFLDRNMDGRVSPLDAVAIINFLNDQASMAAQGEDALPAGGTQFQQSAGELALDEVSIAQLVSVSARAASPREALHRQAFSSGASFVAESPAAAHRRTELPSGNGSIPAAASLDLEILTEELAQSRDKFFFALETTGASDLLDRLLPPGERLAATRRRTENGSATRGRP